MFDRSIARSLMSIIPEKLSATVTLLPDGPAPVTVTVFNAWLKPVECSLSNNGGLNLEGDETLIKIPDHELHPAEERRTIRARDQILIDGINYRVSSARLMTVRTVWECRCRKELA